MKNIIRVAVYSALLASSILIGCKKSNTINNGQVLKAPYSLYFTDSTGALYNTNDGKTFSVVFPSDGFQPRSIITMKENIIWGKPNLYYSSNNGRNFNMSYGYVRSVYKTAVNGRHFDLNQSMLFYSESWAHAYVASTDPAGQNIFGIAYNLAGGAKNTWTPDDYWDTVQITNPHDITVTSFTQLKDGTLVAYDGQHQRTFFRKAFLDRWKESFTTANLPDTMSGNAFFSIGHINNRLVAIDNIGSKGAYYSDDLGLTWVPYTGLPANTPLMAVTSPFEEVCLVGTDGQGVYLLNPNTNTFEPSNNGLLPGATVRNIAYKENVYKNDTREQFVYIATNTGLYRSVDKGHNWVRTIPG
ncbi:MAG: hypothetical protein EBZ77_14135, partial [Chitinophagia bacterium]|nr:hypothetical protein [Chitinophagia bacterium]